LEELKLENPCDTCIEKPHHKGCACLLSLKHQADQQVVDKLKAEIAQLKETIKSYHDTYVKGGNTGFKL